MSILDPNSYPRRFLRFWKWKLFGRREEKIMLRGRYWPH